MQLCLFVHLDNAASPYFAADAQSVFVYTIKEAMKALLSVFYDCYFISLNCRWFCGTRMPHTEVCHQTTASNTNDVLLFG